MNSFKSIKYLLKLIYELSYNKKLLNDDLVNNYNISKNVCKNFINTLDVNVNVIGSNNIPMSGSLLLISNHVSFFDIILLLSIIDRPLPFAAAKELMSYPILREYITSLKCVLIDRETNDMSIMREQIESIQTAIRNNGLIVFPEGECSYDQEVYEFKKGAFLRLNNTTIVPTYISIPALKRIGKWTIPIDDIDIIFGEPFEVKKVFPGRVKADIVSEYSRNKVLELKHSLTIK